MTMAIIAINIHTFINQSLPPEELPPESLDEYDDPLSYELDEHSGLSSNVENGESGIDR